MKTLNELLKSRPVLIDGAWGSQLIAHGLAVGECPEAWNVTHREQVEDVARSYVEAGSHIILTNTFGASRFLLDRYGYGDRVVELNRLGVEISKCAASDKALVFASIGPTGYMLAMGDVTADELREGFKEQAQAMADAGADGIVIETMSDVDEARIAVEAAKTTGLPVVGCMVFGHGKAGDRTMNGVTPEQAAERLTAAGADAVGSNCGCGPAGMLPICTRMKASTNLPIWMKPNAGLPQQVSGRAVFIYNTTPDEFAAEAVDLVTAGADFLGGCCGTGPAFITALKCSIEEKR